MAMLILLVQINNFLQPDFGKRVRQLLEQVLNEIGRSYSTVGFRVAQLLLVEANSQHINRTAIEMFTQSLLDCSKAAVGHGTWIVDRHTNKILMVKPSNK